MSEHPTHTGNSWFATVADAARRRWRSPVIVWVLWFVNVAALGGLVAWIFCDGKFSDVVLALRADLSARLGNGNEIGVWPQLASRVWALYIVGILAVGSAVGIFLGLFLGATTHRRVRSWFAFTLLLATWLTLFASWHELAWRGQVLRLRNQMDGFESVAASLRSDWPAVDGERPGIGPFMAYPIGGPRMLMMLTTPNLPNTRASISTVERSDDGALRFELTGDEPGVWLEWHPPGTAPQSFIGGLMSEYPLDRSEPLGQGWYLVRYQRASEVRGSTAPSSHRAGESVPPPSGDN